MSSNLHSAVIMNVEGEVAALGALVATRSAHGTAAGAACLGADHVHRVVVGVVGAQLRDA